MKLTKILGSPIAFHRCLAELAGSVTSGLMLSQAFYWTSKTNDADGWFWKTQEEWYEETMLSRKEQESARRRLRDIEFDGKPLWIEQLRGVPAKLYYRIDTDVLECLLRAMQNAQKDQPSMPKRDILECPKGTNKIVPNGHTFLLAETTSETTTETTSEREAPARELAPVSSSPDAVSILLEVFPDMPIFSQEVIEAAGITNLELWRTICRDWKDNRYSTRNVTGMRDRYRQQLAKLEESNGQTHNRSTVNRLSANERAARQTLALILGQPFDGSTPDLGELGAADQTGQQSTALRRR